MARKKRIKARTRLRAAGHVFILTAVLVLLAAWNTGANLLYIVFGGLASFMVVSYFWARVSLRGLSISREVPPAVHRGQTLWTLVRIRNEKRFLPVVSLRIARAAKRGDIAGHVLKLSSGRVVELRVAEEFSKRGVYHVPDLLVTTAFPFGLIEARRPLSDNKTVVVYPRVLPARTALLRRLGGRAQAPRSASSDGDEFFSLREYIPGDDLRRVAWRASARQGNLLVRELTHETARHVHFVFDTRLRADVEGFAELFEDAVETIASLGVTLLQRQYTVGLSLPGHRLQASEGKGQIVALLETLARVEPSAEDDPPADLHAGDDQTGMAVLYVSPDPREWGRTNHRGWRVLDPGEVIHA